MCIRGRALAIGIAGLTWALHCGGPGAFAHKLPTYDWTAKGKVTRRSSNITGHERTDTFALKKRMTLRPGQQVRLLLPSQSFPRASGPAILGGWRGAAGLPSPVFDVSSRVIKAGADQGKRELILEVREDLTTASGKPMKGFQLQVGQLGPMGKPVGPIYLGRVKLTGP